VMESKISVERVKFTFKKNLTRKEVAHMAALKKAQITIDGAKIDLDDNDERDDKDSILKNVKVRPSTPVYNLSRA